MARRCENVMFFISIIRFFSSARSDARRSFRPRKTHKWSNGQIKYGAERGFDSLLGRIGCKSVAFPVFAFLR